MPLLNAQLSKIIYNKFKKIALYIQEIFMALYVFQFV